MPAHNASHNTAISCMYTIAVPVSAMPSLSTFYHLTWAGPALYSLPATLLFYFLAFLYHGILLYLLYLAHAMAMPMLALLYSAPAVHGCRRACSSIITACHYIPPHATVLTHSLPAAILSYSQLLSLHMPSSYSVYICLSIPAHACSASLYTTVSPIPVTPVACPLWRRRTTIEAYEWG